MRKKKQVPQPTVRATATALRSYCRPTEDGKTETWTQVVARVRKHQKWLWETALGKTLSPEQEVELDELSTLILERRISPAGRTLWLGGTDISKTRQSSMFNCSHVVVRSLHDIVDILWLLLQGCGVGFTAEVGCLHGYRQELEEIEIIRSTRTTKGGNPGNVETFDAATGVWTIKVGDSAEAWAKAVGKLLFGRYNAKKLVIDNSEIRPPGERLKGYGWISSGDEQISKAFRAIAEILSNRSDQLLTKLDILDIVNWLGTVLSSRRSAEIALCEYGSPEWREFATAKKNWWEHNPQRVQSNNSLVFYRKPSFAELEDVFSIMVEAGGSEPGFINGEQALKRAPWFKGVNPCCEILLGDKSFCNLVEVNLLAFKGNLPALKRAMHLAGRMNYRQTCVDLNDGILQESWHTNNDFLRLCGVGITGVTACPELNSYSYKMLSNIATAAAIGMATELKTPLPKNITTIKPSGTLSKIMGSELWGEVPEGAHRPQGKYIFNEITYSRHDPLVKKFAKAEYHVMDKPGEPESVLVRFPVKYDAVQFTKKTVLHKDGRTEEAEVDTESALDQLERYKMLMESWCEQNVSVTIYYEVEEVPAIVKWVHENWDYYVGVSFIYRSDPTKTAADLGYQYLPQTVVSKATYDAYVEKLKPIKFDEPLDYVEDGPGEECQTGACPIK